MKTILISLAFTFITLQLFAQLKTVSSKVTVNDSLKNLPHFKFKDIPIDGSLNQFVSQLKKQNFTVLDIKDTEALLSGKFADEEVDILVQASTQTVYGVVVSYKKKTTWKAIKTQYENVKSILTSKYGEPKKVIEQFDNSYHEGSGLELFALKKDNCTYTSYFVSDTKNGMILLSITNDASLIINYLDARNYSLTSDAASKDY